jgi:hypothetical protein
MNAETPAAQPQPTVKKNIYRNAPDAVYGLGFSGALVYFIQHATTLAIGLFGVLKAIVWPAIFVYKLLEFLKM